jgi:hypothetical protein
MALMFLQTIDWPMCCGDLTEFTGNPRSLRVLVRPTSRPFSGTSRRYATHVRHTDASNTRFGRVRRTLPAQSGSAESIVVVSGLRLSVTSSGVRFVD